MKNVLFLNDCEFTLTGTNVIFANKEASHLPGFSAKTTKDSEKRSEEISAPPSRGRGDSAQNNPNIP